MKLPKLNWAVVTVVLCLTAGLLYFGYSEWQLRVIQNPLQERISQVAGISTVQFQTGERATVLTIDVDPEVDFPQVASQVSGVIRQEMLHGTSEVVWKDSPNEHLLEVRKQLSLILQEARWRHQFVLMQERLEQVVQAERVSYQLGVDEEYIYLSLQAGSHVMREAIPLLQVGGAAK